MTKTRSKPAKPATRRRVVRDIADKTRSLEAVGRNLADGQDIRSACRAAGVSVPSYYRWRARLRTGDGSPDRAREAILVAARTLFLRDGYGTSIEAIAETAEVARQTVYNQFGSKERLFAEIVQSVYQRIVGPAVKVDRGANIVAALTGFGRDVMRIAYDPDNIALQRIALGEYRATPELATVADALRAAHVIPVLTEFIAEYLDHQMDRGVIDRADPAMAAEAFVGSFTGYGRYRRLIGIDDKGPTWDEEILKMCVTIFVRGLGYRSDDVPSLRMADP